MFVHMAEEHSFNIAFVSEVEKHPELYNCNLPSYSRKDLVEKVWGEVGQKMKMSATESKERWKNLRAVFIRNLKAQARDGASGSRKKRPYYLMEAMNFALPFVKTNVLPPSSDVAPANQQIHEAPPVKVEIIEGYGLEEYDSQQSEGLSSPPSRYSPLPTSNNLNSPLGNHSDSRGTKRTMSTDPEYIEYLAAKKATLAAPTEGERKTGAIRSFLDSLVPELESMTEDQLKLFRRRVFGLIDSIIQPFPTNF